MRDIVAFELITSSSDLSRELAEYAAVIGMSPEGMDGERVRRIAENCGELRRIAPELRRSAPELRGGPIDSTVEMMKQMRIGKKYSGAKPIEKPSAVAMPFHRNVTGEFDDVRYL